MNRRIFLTASSLFLVGCGNRSFMDADTTKVMVANDPQITALENEIGGRIGVALLDGEGFLVMAHRPSERFAMCSTFKAPLAAQLVAAHYAGDVNMYARFSLNPSDKVPYMPFVEKRMEAGEKVSLFELAGATVATSDNAAANIILKALGGPAAFTAFVREKGDDVTRLDRIEPFLNENAVGDLRDTTTPEAMARLIDRLAGARAQSKPEQLMLQQWMRSSVTGKERIKAGLPQGWPVGSKTGTAPGGLAYNDVALIWPSTAEYAGPPAVLAVYVDRPKAAAKAVEAAIAAIARLAVQSISLPD